MTDQLRLTTLGGLGLQLGTRPLLPGRRKLLLLLAYLARREGVASRRSELAALFWPGSDERRARASLRQALVELRAAVGDPLTITDEEVLLRPGAIVVDATALRLDADAGRFREVAARWQGAFLDGAELELGEELRGWLEREREELRRRRAAAGAELVREAEARGAWAEAREHAAAWCAALPSDATAAQRLEEMQRLAGRRVAPPFPHAAALLTPDLVGRSAEFARLTAAWAGVERGEAGLLLLEGEPGTGRSRLLLELARWLAARPRPPVLLSSAAYEAETARPLILLRHLLAPLASAPGAAAAPAAALRALAAALPEFAERFARLPTGPAEQLPLAVAQVLAAVAEEAPVAVLVDDAHLADDESRAVLDALLRRAVPGVLLVLSSLPGQWDAGALERRAPEQGRLTRITPAPLDATQVEQLLASMADFEPGERTALAARLLAETGGNPLAVVEFTTMLAENGMIAPAADGQWRVHLPADGQPLPVPAGLRESLAARLQVLDPPARQLLRATALLGRDAELALLSSLTGQDAATFEAALEQLASRRLVRVTGETPARLAFVRDELRRIVYDELPPLTRQEWHGRAARLIGARPGRGSGSLATVDYHRGRAGPARRWGRRPAMALVVVAALLLAVLLVARRWHRPPEARRVVLAGFRAEGAEAEPLAPLVSQLLALALDGTGGITVVEGPGADTTEGGGTTVVEGRVSRHGAGVQVSAELHEAGGQHRVVAHGSVTGAASEVAPLVGALARQLVGPRDDPPGATFVLDAARTASLEALENYVTGERLARRWEMQDAAQALWRATRADPGFAAAWHALARVNAWYWLDDRARRMADSAAAHPAGLAPTETQLLQAWLSFAKGDAEEAEQRFRAVLAYDGASAEANAGLGEVLFHHNAMRGRDVEEARPYWEAAARLDPRDWRPVFHRWELAVRAGRGAEASRLLDGVTIRSGDSGFVSGERLVVAAREGDSAGIRQRLEGLDRGNEWMLANTATGLAVLADRPDVSRAVAAVLAHAGRTRASSAYGYESLAQLDLAAGKWRAAQRALDSAAALEPVSAATTRAYLLVAPFVPAAMRTEAARRAAAVALQRAPPGPVQRTFIFWFDFDRTREWIIRPYLAALLEPAPGAAPRLTAQPGAPFPDSLAHLQQVLTQSLEVHAVLVRGDTTGALQLLATGWDGIEASEALFSPAYERPWDLYLKAMLLAEAGRPEEAMRRYGGIGENSLDGYMYSAPGAFRRGRLLEQLGRPADAAREYRRVLRLWRDADPEFQPVVDSARARVAALGGGAS